MNQPDGAVSDWKQPWYKLTIYYCKAWCSHWKTLEIIHGTETKVSAAESDAPEGTQLWQTPLGAQTRVFFECWFHRVRTDLLPCKRKLASVLNDRQTWVCCLWKPLHWMCHKTSEKTMEKLYIKISQALEGQQCKYTPWLTRCLHYK